MQAEVRLLQIRTQFADLIVHIVPLVLEEETLQVIAYLQDGTNLRVTEKWKGETLERYGYYWLTSENQLRIGWDNAPHHQQLENFPHHKHVAGQPTPPSSDETTLEAVTQVISRHGE